MRATSWPTTFLSTPSARRATTQKPTRTKEIQISIHALREEGDLPLYATRLLALSISIHALREEGDAPTGMPRRVHSISIHALREEGDRLRRLCYAIFGGISIHALREEGDSKNREKILCFCLSIYQSAQNW